MTTKIASPQGRSNAAPARGPGVLRGGLVALAAITTVVALAGALVSGSDAFLGALAGAGAVLLVFVFGAVVVGAASRALPGAALLVALLTYTLQLLVLLLFFVAFHDSAAARGALSGDWLGVGMIAATLAWIMGQLVVTLRTPVEPWEAGA